MVDGMKPVLVWKEGATVIPQARNSFPPIFPPTFVFFFLILLDLIDRLSLARIPAVQPVLILLVEPVNERVHCFRLVPALFSSLIVKPESNEILRSVRGPRLVPCRRPRGQRNRSPVGWRVIVPVVADPLLDLLQMFCVRPLVPQGGRNVHPLPLLIAWGKAELAEVLSSPALDRDEVYTSIQYSGLNRLEGKGDMTRRSPSGLVNGGVDIVGANDEREGRIVRRKAASSEEIGEGLKGKREVAEHTYTVDVACLEGQRSLQACPNYGPQQISQQISLDQAAPIGSEGGPSRRPTNSIVSHTPWKL